MLEAIGLSRARAKEVVRISFSCETTPSEVDRAVDALIDEVDALRAIAPPHASKPAPRRVR